MLHWKTVETKGLVTGFNINSVTFAVCAELQGQSALFCRGGGLVQTRDRNCALNHQLIQPPILKYAAHLRSELHRTAIKSYKTGHPVMRTFERAAWGSVTCPRTL